MGSSFEELVEAVPGQLRSHQARKHLDNELRELVGRIEALLRDLDPIKQPQFVFDPAEPAVVGRFIGLALVAQPRLRLSAVDNFYGSGVYSLYYTGSFPAYDPIGATETPIYVGKADPKSDTAKTPLEQGTRLANRLKDHARNIRKANDTIDIDDFEYRSLVVQSGWQSAAEDYLIHLFQPAWNSETGICYGLGKHGDDPKTRANLRSPWDTLHPGRDWAWRDPSMRDARSREHILADLKRHLTESNIFRDVGQVLDGFLDELRQLE